MFSFNLKTYGISLFLEFQKLNIDHRKTWTELGPCISQTNPCFLKTTTGVPYWFVKHNNNQNFIGNELIKSNWYISQVK